VKPLVLLDVEQPALHAVDSDPMPCLTDDHPASMVEVMQRDAG
jgi:hypothetical protein